MQYTTSIEATYIRQEGCLIRTYLLRFRPARAAEWKRGVLSVPSHLLRPRVHAFVPHSSAIRLHEVCRLKHPTIAKQRLCSFHVSFHLGSMQQGKLYLFSGLVMTLIQGGLVRRVRAEAQDKLALNVTIFN